LEVTTVIVDGFAVMMGDVIAVPVIIAADTMAGTVIMADIIDVGLVPGRLSVVLQLVPLSVARLPNHTMSVATLHLAGTLTPAMRM